MLKFVLLIVFSLILSIKSQPPAVNVYTVVTEVGGDFSETIVWTGKVDLASGEIVKLVENFLYVGGSATYDGISDYDPGNRIYYFSNDYATSFIYSSNLNNQLLLPTIDTGAKTVMRMHHDNTNQRLLSVQQQSTGGGYIIQVPTSQSQGKAQVVTALPANTNYVEILASAFDSGLQNFYLIAGNASNVTGPYAISTANLNSSPPTFQSFPLSQACPSGLNAKTFPQYAAWDTNKNQLVMGVEQFVGNDLKYFIYLALPNGQCTSKPIPLTIFGIATAWSYDQNSRTMFFSLAPNGYPQLYYINVDTMVLSSPITVAYVPSSLQVSTN